MSSRSHSLRKLFRALLVALLAGCGGGGGGDGAAPSGSPSTPNLNPAAPPPTGTIVGSTSPLPSSGARAVPTFESIGLYWTPPSTPSAHGWAVIFRQPRGD